MNCIKKNRFTAFLFISVFAISVFAQNSNEDSLSSLLLTQAAKSTNAKTDYIQIILYGQSLGLGWQCPRAISTVPIIGNYMIGDNVNILYNLGATVLNPLIATKWKSGGEQPMVGCVNAFSKVYHDNVDATQKFIAMTAGEGGRTIERLSKECTNNGYYTSTFLKILDNTLTTLVGKTVSCPAILYMQGEYNCSASWAQNQGLTPGTNGTTDKNVYKALLLKLKNNMQADIMEKYGQAEKPIFFIYQTSGTYITTKEMPIVMAQIEFANENSDVVLMNPHYALPDYDGGHLSTNGYRWYGEIMAKSLSETLVRKNTYKTLKPIKFDIKGQTITIDYQVPVAPLVLDTLITPKQTNYGFTIYKAGIVVPISRFQITADNKVIITCNSVLTGKIEIVYAGSATKGSGNLRDSDGAASIFTYFDDSTDTPKETYTPVNQNGVKIYGQPYGLQNWSDEFYYVFDNVQADIDKISYNPVSLSPNPVKSFVKIDYDLQGILHGKCTIYDFQGNQVINHQIYGNDKSLLINMDNLPIGLYICKIEANERLFKQIEFIKD